MQWVFVQILIDVVVDAKNHLELIVLMGEEMALLKDVDVIVVTIPLVRQVVNLDNLLRDIDEGMDEMYKDNRLGQDLSSCTSLGSNEEGLLVIQCRVLSIVCVTTRM